MIEVTLRVDGRRHSGAVNPRTTLADFLREELSITSVHLGCEHGECGACTLLVNGASARSCLMLAAQADGAVVSTVEGLVDGDRLHPLQEAMRESHSFQCTFCAPGFIMTALEFLRENPHPSESEVRSAIRGNFCRCTGYQAIVTGIMRAAQRGAVEPAEATGPTGGCATAE